MSDPDDRTPVERPTRCACCAAWIDLYGETKNAAQILQGRMARYKRGLDTLSEVEAAIDRVLLSVRQHAPECSRR